MHLPLNSLFYLISDQKSFYSDDLLNAMVEGVIPVAIYSEFNYESTAVDDNYLWAVWEL